MDFTGILIPANAEVDASKIEFDGEDLPTVQQLVGGDLQTMELPGAEAALWFNESGKSDELAVNYRATFLFWLYRPEFMRVGDLLVGDVLVVGLPSDHYDMDDVPEELATLLFDVDHYQVTWQFKGKTERNNQTIVFTDWPTAFEYACQMQHRNRNIEEVRVIPA